MWLSYCTSLHFCVSNMWQNIVVRDLKIQWKCSLDLLMKTEVFQGKFLREKPCLSWVQWKYLEKDTCFLPHQPFSQSERASTFQVWHKFDLLKKWLVPAELALRILFIAKKKGIIRSLASAIHPNPSNDSYQRIHSAIALLWCTYWHFNTLKGKLRCSPTADTGMEFFFFFCGSGMTSDPPRGKYSWASTQRWSVTQLETGTSFLWNKVWLTMVDLNRITILK